MNIDIRLSLDFFEHPKTIKLQKRCGVDGVHSLLRLWCWAASYRPKGHLDDLDNEDIEIAAKWSGENGIFVAALIACGFLDKTENGFVLHDWEERQQYACLSEERHEKAQKAAQARWEKEHNKQNDATSNANGNATSNASGIAKNENEQCPKTPRYQDTNIPKSQLRESGENSPQHPPKEPEKPIPPEYVQFAQDFQELVAADQGECAPKITPRLIQDGAKELDKAIRLDGFELDEIRRALAWAQSDYFWRSNLLSLAQMRKKTSNGTSKIQTIVSQYRRSLVPHKAGPPQYESKYERDQRARRESMAETMRILGMLDGETIDNGEENGKGSADFIDVSSF